MVFGCLFALALVRTAAAADECSERLFAEYLREQERALETITSASIEAGRIHAQDAVKALSHRRTWRSPSSA